MKKKLTPVVALKRNRDNNGSRSSLRETSHTDNDTVVYLPEEKIVFAGDLIRKRISICNSR